MLRLSKLKREKGSFLAKLCKQNAYFQRSVPQKTSKCRQFFFSFREKEKVSIFILLSGWLLLLIGRYL